MSKGSLSEKYDLVIPIIVDRNKEFFHSPEYRQLVGNAEDLPGVIACAYARFLSRLIHSGRMESLRELISPINRIASWNDPKVNIMIQDEFIEQLIADNVLDIARPEMNEYLARFAEGR